MADHTISEKIIAAHAGVDEVRPGQFVEARVDFCLGNDVTAPIAIREFRSLGDAHVFDPERIALIPDHFTPNKDIKSAEQCKLMREFARDEGIEHYYEVGRCGIEHAFLPEQGLVLPGELIIGADSHTCTYGAVGAFATGVGSTDLAAAMALGKVWLRVPETMRFIFKGELPRHVGGKDLVLRVIGDIGVDGALYRAMEFAGEVIEKLPLDGRFTICNMAIEAGGKAGLVEPDAAVEEYCRGRAARGYGAVHGDPDAELLEVREYDVSDMSPLVACPHLPSNVTAVGDLKGVRIDQVVIGSCTNGRVTDIREAASVLRGRKIAQHVRAIVIPATVGVFKQVLKEGITEELVDAGCVVSPPTCGPCLGGHMGVLAAGERCVATTNRNFAGRMGHLESEVYLANPAVAAASAVLGRIGSPAELE